MKLALCFLAVFVVVSHQQLHDYRMYRFPWFVNLQRQSDDNHYYPIANRFDDYPLGRFNPILSNTLDSVDVSRQSCTVLNIYFEYYSTQNCYSGRNKPVVHARNDSGKIQRFQRNILERKATAAILPRRVKRCQ